MHVEAESTGFSLKFKSHVDLRYHVENLQAMLARCEKAEIEEGIRYYEPGLTYYVGVELEKIISPLAREIVAEAVLGYYHSLPGEEPEDEERKEGDKPTPGEMFDPLAGIL